MATPTGTLTTSITQRKLPGRIFLVILILGMAGIAKYVTQYTDPKSGPTPVIYQLICIAMPLGFIIPVGNIAIRPTKRFELYTDGFILRRVLDKHILVAATWSEVTQITCPLNKSVFTQRTFLAGFLFGIVGFLIASRRESQQSEPTMDGPAPNAIYIHLPNRKVTIDATFFIANRMSALMLRDTIIDTFVSGILNRIDNGEDVEIGNIRLSSTGIYEPDGSLIEWIFITHARRNGCIAEYRYQGKWKYVNFRLDFQAVLLFEIINCKLGKKFKLTSLSERLGIM